VALSSCSFPKLATFPTIAQRIVLLFGRPSMLLVFGGLANLGAPHTFGTVHFFFLEISICSLPILVA
jgi:hypothetical protein